MFFFLIIWVWAVQRCDVFMYFLMSFLFNLYCDLLVSVFSGPSPPSHPDRCHRFDQAACWMPTLSSGSVGTKCWSHWDWSGRLHRERPIRPDRRQWSTAGPPHWAGMCGGAGWPVGPIKAGMMESEWEEKEEEEEEEGVCQSWKYQRDPGNVWKCWGKSGQHTESIWVCSAPSWEEATGAGLRLDFYVHMKSHKHKRIHHHITSGLNTTKYKLKVKT